MDAAAIPEAEPLRGAFAVLAKGPVERSVHGREVRPVARESPALNEAEHLRGDASAAVQLLERCETLPADEQDRRMMLRELRAGKKEKRRQIQENIKSRIIGHGKKHTEK